MEKVLTILSLNLLLLVLRSSYLNYNNIYYVPKCYSLKEVKELMIQGHIAELY